uniref:Uncharacterized protein n=1 Tax=Utricularia reniformis TaxID=192314 RepID=A0A1Y0B4P5_9LAMI|nr:hypothetical protein AEK19_MT2201 [Utricularia reniformis]ART32347.1 hypothetical protein AEK19_MT2201 [Utricularia reniformis]
MVKIHFSNSMNFIDNLFLLYSFYKLPILDKDGNRKNPDSRMGIPPVGMISKVLLNLFLVNLDREFRSSPFFIIEGISMRLSLLSLCQVLMIMQQ